MNFCIMSQLKSHLFLHFVFFCFHRPQIITSTVQIIRQKQWTLMKGLEKEREEELNRNMKEEKKLLTSRAFVENYIKNIHFFKRKVFCVVWISKSRFFFVLTSWVFCIYQRSNDNSLIIMCVTFGVFHLPILFRT